MKILFVCHRFPYPPSRGGKIRPYNTIKHLHQTHEVHVVSLARSAEELEAGHGIAPFCTKYHIHRISAAAAWRRMLLRAPTCSPSSMGYFYAPDLANDIHMLIEQHEYDLVFVHCAFVAPYVAAVEGPCKILDFGDMDSQKWLTYARFKSPIVAPLYWYEGKKLEAAEKALAERFSLCTCTTRAELETLQGFGTETPSDWFPNGVDLAYFQPSAESYDPNQICFVGRMDYYPNIHAISNFVATTLPLIRAKHPGAELSIVGAAPVQQIRDLAKIDGVTVTGTVSDVRPHVTKAAVCVAPLQIARGTQNKILESLAMGVPMVSSSQAAGGVDTEPTEHLLVADGPDETAAAVLRILEDADERKRLAAAGRARMETNHSWESSMARLDKIIERTMAR